MLAMIVAAAAAVVEEVMDLPPPLFTYGNFVFRIKTPQLIGIICGCVVFTVTIMVVIFLLYKSGTIAGFLEEMRAGGDGKSVGRKASVQTQAQLDLRPELYDHLILASQTLPLKPAPPTFKCRKMTLRPLDVRRDVAELVSASDGRPKYHECAYDPAARIWGALDLPPTVQRSNANAGSEEVRLPCASEQDFTTTFGSAGPDECHMVIVDAVLDKPVGMLSLVHNRPRHLTIQIENVWLTPAYQGQRMVHEALLSLLRWLFESGYRRVVVEVDVRHVVARKLFEKCGFVSEAVLRKHRISCRRNRDSCLYVLLNSEWLEKEVALKLFLGIDIKAKVKKEEEEDRDSKGIRSLVGGTIETVAGAGGGGGEGKKKKKRKKKKKTSATTNAFGDVVVSSSSSNSTSKDIASATAEEEEESDEGDESDD